jgi:hypothetical protein
MNEDEQGKLRLSNELERLRRERDSEKKATWFMWFLAIWLLPLLGMELVQGDDLPKMAGPNWPVVGRMSIWGMWFLGVPLVTLIWRKFLR